MTKVLGFLTGVCLTVVVFVLVLDRRQLQGEEEAPPVSVATDVKPDDLVPAPADEALDSDRARSKSNADTEKDDVIVLTDSSVDDTTQTNSTHADNEADEPDTVGEPSEPADSKPQTIIVMSAADEQTVGDITKVAVKPTENSESLALEQVPQQVIGISNPHQTHVFWSPFRSEWAAKGFARRLSNATQIPIEVVEVGSGQYRVSFDYQDESQRLEQVERIEFITGLQLE